METSFPYEDDLLKHYVRYKGWLPACKRRKTTIHSVVAANRRLKYFTFCASGAVDVLMLDVAKIVQPSSSGRFDNVVFFERNADFVPDIQRRVPGSIGFPGDFINVVLMDDAHEEELIDGFDALASPEQGDDIAQNRERMRQLAQRRDFISQFPFDIINLDLQDFFFRPRDPLPGRLVNCMRKVFAWQQRPIRSLRGSPSISGFTLMFTTQVGPTNMTPEYKNMLLECVSSNVAKFPELKPLLLKRLQGVPWIDCPEKNFSEFFKIAAPKIIASVLNESDWYITGETGLEIYEFGRSCQSGPYQILHLILDIKRKKPPLSARAPGADDADSIRDYCSAVGKIFEIPCLIVNEELVKTCFAELQKNLNYINARRKKYESSS